MVYLAILLILCGLLILITALSIETGKTAPGRSMMPRGSNGLSDNYSKGSYGGDFAAEEVEVIFPGDKLDERNDSIDKEDIFISFDDDSDYLNEVERIPDVESLRDDGDEAIQIQTGREAFPDERRKPDLSVMPEIIERKEAASPLCDQDDGEVSAIMFDDRSNIIDYESGSGAIDSTFSKYKSIKRIGKGKIESDYDGVNFYLGEKLYRFDFHKVYDIWSGSNYIALPLKGSSTVKLFLIENSAGFPEKVEADFKEYEKGL